MNKRIEIIDSIRGFALFGVLVVNLTMMHTNILGMVPTNRLDILFSTIIHHVFVGKFYTIFSFLFGYSFYLFLSKRDADLFKRRLIALLFIGSLHLVGIWYGDILHTYALTGFILLGMRHKTLPELKKTMIKCLIIALLAFGTVAYLNTLSQSPDAFNESYSLLASTAYQSASYMELVSFRITHELPYLIFNIIVIPKILFLFLAGYYAGRIGLFARLDAFKDTIDQTFVLSGLLYVILTLAILFINAMTTAPLWKVLAALAFEINTLLGATFFILLITKLNQHSPLLKPLASIGRMALTNYLVQTLFFTTFFNGYGFGFYETLSYWMFLPIAVAFFTLQILASTYWLHHFQMGPMESLWRSFTYWRSK